MDILYSIVVPIYNIEEYVEVCINSLIKQTYKNIEIILVDDGSIDNSPVICDSFAKKDTRIKVIHKKNGGLVSARKAGASIAKGEYIACVDGDDWVEIDYIETANNYISNFNRKLDIFCCGAKWVYEDKTVDVQLEFPEGYYNREKIESEFIPILIESKNGVYFPPSLWAKIFKKEIYLKQQLRVPENFSIGEDSACVKPCVYNSKNIYIMENCLYNYRQNPYSMTKNKKPFNWNGPELIAKHLESVLPMDKFDFQEQIYRNFVHNLFNVAVSQFNRKENTKIIKSDISKHISTAYCRNAIRNCCYGLKYWKGSLAKLTLKYKLFYLIKLYNKIINK